MIIFSSIIQLLQLENTKEETKMTNPLPKHINHVHNDRKAIAPYNFVELPDKIVEVDKNSLPSHDRYHSDRHTGKIECTLTTSSPLYIRCGYTLDEYADFSEKLFYQLTEEQKSKRADFFKNPSNLKPVIPGSSLRGMLRTLVEIITFSKIDRVSGEDHFFFRAVAADQEDPLKTEYSKYLNKNNIRAGYLRKQGDNWVIHPVREIQGVTFAWVKEAHISGLAEFIPMDDENYVPQYIQISYSEIRRRQSGYFAEDVSLPNVYPSNSGVLVTSGNMKSNSDAPTVRRNHCIVFPKSPNPRTFEIDKSAIQHYQSALTKFQKDIPFSENNGVLKEDRPIFYCQPEAGNPVTLFGQSPNFRIPFSPQGNGQSATARDFIPPILKDPEKEEDRKPIIDIAESIFGYVRRDKRKDSDQALAGRIFVSDAMYTSKDDVWDQEQAIIPQILTGPKPTTFQHYLVQPQETNAEKRLLKHYASQGTVIRGHKFYWHKGSNPQIRHPNPQDAQENHETQITKIKPINVGVSFEFNIYFENLSEIELGALLWVLEVAQDDNYRLSLGMGKPLGMGAIKIDHKLYLSKGREDRYKNLFFNKSWAISETETDPGFASEFENYMAERLMHIGSFRNHRRIQMLLSMLNWNDIPPVTETRYMEIEREANPLDGNSNEYKTRRVLPTPLDVRRSDRTHNRNNPPSSSPPDISIAETQLEARNNNTQFKEGDVVQAKITKIDGKRVSYELSDGTKRTEDRCKKADSLAIEENVQVKISLKPDGSIKSLKYFSSQE